MDKNVKYIRCISDAEQTACMQLN